MSKPGTESRPANGRRGFAWLCLISLLLAEGSAQAAGPGPVKGLPPGVDQVRWEAFTQANPGLDEKAARAQLTRRETAWSLAQAQGLLRGHDWDAFKSGLRRKLLGEAYLKAIPGHPLVTEAKAKSIYLGQGEERKVWHLLRPDQESATKALARLKAGEDAGALARELSVDPSAKQNRGDLDWIRKEQVVAPFGEAVFGQPVGTWLGPFQTEFGWHLAKALDSRRPTEEGWQKEGSDFRARLVREQQASNRGSALKPLRARYPLEKDMTVLGRDRTTRPVLGDDKLVAGRVAGQALSLAALKIHLQATLGSSGGSHSLGPEMKGSLLEGLADEVRLEAAAVAMGLQRKPAVLAALWNGQRDEALARFSMAYLGRLKVPDADLEAHRAKDPQRFLGAGTLKLIQLAFASQNDADRARLAADQGVAWPELHQRHADKEATGAWDLGWVEVSSLKATLGAATAEQLQKAALDQVVGPVPGPDGPMLFRVLDRKPGPPLALEAARDEVRADYLKIHGEALVKAHLDAKSQVRRKDRS